MSLGRRLPERTATAIGFAALAGFAVVVWWPTRELPYHWDAADFVVDGTRELAARGFRPLVVGRSDFPHAPLFHLLLAGAWAIFGESRAVAHALVLPFFFLLLASTYAVARRAVDVATGVAATALVATTPVVLAELGQVYVDLPAAGLTTAGIAAWQRERRLLAAIAFAGAASMKEAPLLVPGCLAIGLALEARARRDVRAWLALATPFAVLGAWLVYHRLVMGWWLTRPGFVAPPRQLVPELLTVGRELLVAQGRFALAVPAVLATAWLAARGRPHLARLAPIAPLAATIPAALVFFTAVGVFGMRYAIFLLPPLAVAALAPLRATLPRTPVFAASAAFPIALAFRAWHPEKPLTDGYVFRPQDDLSYLDLLAAGRDAAAWVERNRPDAQIFGAFPESYQLTEPWQGYVSRPLAFAPCTAFVRDPSRAQLVYVHAHSHGQVACKRLTDALGARAVKRFVHDGTWIEIWSVPRKKPTGS